MRNFCASCLVIAFLSTSAVAADTPKAKKTDPEKIICKTDRSTGSMIAGRICKKRSEWEEEKVQAQELLNEHNRGSRQSDRPRGGG
jgi:hypothetical protein